MTALLRSQCRYWQEQHEITFPKDKRAVRLGIESENALKDFCALNEKVGALLRCK